MWNHVLKNIATAILGVTMLGSASFAHADSSVAESYGRCLNELRPRSLSASAVETAKASWGAQNASGQWPNWEWSQSRYIKAGPSDASDWIEIDGTRGAVNGIYHIQADQTFFVPASVDSSYKQYSPLQVSKSGWEVLTDSELLKLLDHDLMLRMRSMLLMYRAGVKVFGQDLQPELFRAEYYLRSLIRCKDDRFAESAAEAGRLIEAFRALYSLEKPAPFKPIFEQRPARVSPILPDKSGMISKQDCGEFDFTNHFGPTRDQKGLGLCWAFAGTALLEEQACLQDPLSCGKSLSALDASRCNWTVGSSEGGYNLNALNCVLRAGGICTEESAPYDATLNIELIKVFFLKWRSILTDEMVQSYVSAPHLANDRVSANPGLPVLNLSVVFPEIQTYLAEYRTLVGESAGSRIDPVIALRNANSQSDFLRLILIPDRCRNNRGLTGLTQTVQGEAANIVKESSVEAKYRELLEGFSRGRSTGISVWLSHGAFSASDDSDHHAIVVVGSHWNESKARCEIRIRNSWGGHDRLEGWQDANEVLSSTYAMTYLHERD